MSLSSESSTNDEMDLRSERNSSGHRPDYAGRDRVLLVFSFHIRGFEMGMTTDAVQQVLDSIRAGRPAKISGPPGCNKSASVAPGGEIFEARRKDHGISAEQMGYRDFRLSMEDPTEIKGMPYLDIENRVTTWLRPDWFPTEDEPYGILVIEELGNAQQVHFPAIYQLTAERRIRDMQLPPGWDIVATTNRIEDGCGVRKLPRALDDRFNDVKWDPSNPDWTKWARAHGVDRRVIAACNFHTDFIEKFDGRANGQQSTGRSITAFSDILKSSGCEVTGTRKDARDERDVGLVGDDKRVYRFAKGELGAEDAARMIAFLGIFARLPDIAGILNGMNVPTPGDEDADVALATITKLVEKGDSSNVKNILSWVDSLPSVVKAVFANDAVESRLGKTDSFLQWMRTNSHLIY